MKSTVNHEKRKPVDTRVIGAVAQSFGMLVIRLSPLVWRILSQSGHKHTVIVDKLKALSVGILCNQENVPVLQVAVRYFGSVELFSHLHQQFVRDRLE